MTMISVHIGKEDTHKNTALNRSTMLIKELKNVTSCKIPAVSKEKKIF